jgi:hypothetical protein
VDQLFVDPPPTIGDQACEADDDQHHCVSLPEGGRLHIVVQCVAPCKKQLLGLLEIYIPTPERVGYGSIDPTSA